MLGFHDVLIVGGGMAGLTAALAAIETGSTVAVIEPDSMPGGSARWSSGRIWSLGGYDELRQAIPLGDPDLQRVHAATLPAAIDWLSSHVALVPQRAGKTGRGVEMTLGRPGDRTEYFAALAAIIVRRGGQVLLGHRVWSVHQKDGALAADIQSTADSARQTILARALVIATGGFQGDREALKAHLGPDAAHLMIRSNPHSKGDGFRSALAMDGSVSGGMDGFYGKTMPLHAEILSPHEYKAHTLDVARASIAINRAGQRFVDETSGHSGEGLANAAIHQPDGAYFIICDGSQASQVPTEKFDALAQRAQVQPSVVQLGATSIEDLAFQMERHWGIPMSTFVETVNSVNQAVSTGNADRLVPPRKVVPTALCNPPFIAIACQAAITIPFGGLQINEHAELLAGEGRRVPGVYICGADAGGIYNQCYGGGLAWALTSGLIAGRNAAAHAASQVLRARKQAVH